MRALAVLALLSGCSVPFMYEVKPAQTLKPAPGTGLVVFVRPSGWGSGANADILDESGRYVGTPPAEGHFAVAVPPGRHQFVIWSENTDAVQIDVAEGRIYFVEVAITPGWVTASFNLYAITPRTPSWPHRDEWMRDTKQFRADAPGGQGKLAGREGDVAERLRRGREHLLQYAGTADEPKHIVAATDGI